jgi:fatty-acyl-CoA synthase
MTAFAPKPDGSKPSVSKTWLRAIQGAETPTADPGLTLAGLIEAQAARLGDRPALLSDLESYSYADLAARGRRYTRWALSLGLAKGDGVALFMNNRPDYVAAWTGLSRMGVVVSLLNTQLRGAALAHCIDTVGPAHVLVDAGLALALQDAPAASKPRVWTASPTFDLSAFEDEPFAPGAFAPVTQADPALHIFTSGTTGLPKAARISHARILSWSGWFAGLLDVTPQDRLYDSLPLYHSVGGVTAIGAALAGGASVVVVEKFSASHFWSDIARWDCTLFQYIGELCRYLLAAPPHPDETRHRLRLMVGNGLRGDVWTAFQARFAVPQVMEFYAATEGSFSLFNVEGQPGAIGRTPAFLAHRFPVALVRFDAGKGAPMRDAEGRCIACGPDEAGEAIGRVSMSVAAGPAAFEGYTDAKASAAKLLRDVFEPGDAWFRTGDLMRRDAAGFFYFVDRIGDTFRWKGENVSTQEVADAVARCPGVTAAVVYGVAIPGADGKAGMAALMVEDRFDPAALAAGLAEELPAYARPLVLRIMDTLPSTETFKLKSQALAAEGFDPSTIGDRLLLFDASRQFYRPLDPALYARVSAGRIRL